MSKVYPVTTEPEVKQGVIAHFFQQIQAKQTYIESYIDCQRKQNITTI